MWPFSKRQSSPPSSESFPYPHDYREEFLQQNSDLLIDRILRDAFSYGLFAPKTSVPLFPSCNAPLNPYECNQTLSLFEVCHTTISRGIFRYTYLSATGAGYSDDFSLSPEYPFYESKTPFCSHRPRPLRELLQIPLGILYEINQSFALKQRLFKDKLVLYVDGLRQFGNQTSATYVDLFRESVREQAQTIFSNSSLWIFDAKDRIEQPPFVSAEIKTGIDFAYSEISRILGIPQTHLLGKSPHGMNATGKSDEENYRKILRGLLDSLILPILKVGDPHYQQPHSLQITEVSETLPILSSLQKEELGLSQDQRVRMKEALLTKLGLGEAYPKKP